MGTVRNVKDRSKRLNRLKKIARKFDYEPMHLVTKLVNFIIRTRSLVLLFFSVL